MDETSVELASDDVIIARDGDFTILYHLGGGAYGSVYRARWRAASDGRGGPPIPTDVVLKRLRRRTAQGESEAEFNARVDREAEMTLHLIPARLRSEVGVDATTVCGSAISCEIHQFAIAYDTRFLVFPWMAEAETLRRYVDRHLHTPETASLTSVAERDLVMARVAADVFLTLSFLHRSRIVHCDIKADNFIVYLDVVDNERRVQIVDFGFACATSTHTANERRAGSAPIDSNLACDEHYRQFYRLRDPMSLSRLTFPFNPIYNGRRGVPLVAFPTPEQRAYYYPIFERYSAAAMLVDLYAYNAAASLRLSGVPVLISDQIPEGRWHNHPIPPPMYGLILACTQSEPRATAEEALDLALRALTTADRAYRMQQWRSGEKNE